MLYSPLQTNSLRLTLVSFVYMSLSIFTVGCHKHLFLMRFCILNETFCILTNNSLTFATCLLINVFVQINMQDLLNVKSYVFIQHKNFIKTFPIASSVFALKKHADLVMWNFYLFL